MLKLPRHIVELKSNSKGKSQYISSNNVNNDIKNSNGS